MKGFDSEFSQVLRKTKESMDFGFLGVVRVFCLLTTANKILKQNLI